ncbi:hypothetical protein N431DRAFT_345092 [Stipitochalara longipes BDJ]|nr:hypothetical protein N431DRAFT_345092 [Stipitochalara longipes BDJ]
MTTWRPNESLKGLVDGKAKIWSSLSAPTNTPCTTCTTCTSTTKFPRSFSAWHLKFLAGFSIVWTNNLSDHLLVLDNEAEVTVYIFHQVKLLELHQNMPLNIIPPDLILETFDTLALLFPRTSQRNRTWYSNLEELYGLDPGAFRCPYLTLEDHEIHHFRYWGARLANLKRAFDEHEPTGPIQWWRDDRKRVQWYTFWVAILVLVLTILFGLIQSVAAILQVIKS